MNFFKTSIALLLALLVANPACCCVFMQSKSAATWSEGSPSSCCGSESGDTLPEDSDKSGHQCACTQMAQTADDSKVTAPSLKLVSILQPDQSEQALFGDAPRFERGHWPKLSARPPDWVDRTLTCVYLL